MSSSATIREATCSCGKLRATVNGEPISVGVSHCLDCQRRTGGPFAQQARWKSEHVTIERRSTQYTRHKDDGGASCTFSFCPACGATVFFQNADRLDQYAIPVGAFADPGFPAPQHSIWEERQHAWVRMPDEIEHLF